jgi:mono/diheme cytochrome c family protein
MRLKTWAFRLGGLLAILVLLLGAAVAWGLHAAEQKMNRVLTVEVRGVPYRSDAAALERGKYLFASRGCVDCHGAQANGRVFVDDGKGLRIVGPNLTTGSQSVVASYTEKDWERAIRHGVNPLGRPLRIMPSEDYNRFSDDDLASLVAYVRSLPPTAGLAADVQMPLPPRVLYGFGVIQDAAARIDHSLPPQAPVAAGVTREHGAYVANMCLGCHGEKLAGGKIAAGPPDWPPAADLRGGSVAMARYADAASFARMFRTGKRPDGSAIQVMPFESLSQMNDIDLQALHLYLRALPPAPKG